MFAKWIRSRRVLVVLGIAVLSWATFQRNSVASGNFILTDRIGEGSVFLAAQRIRPEMDAHILYFQGGHPVALARIRADEPYCRFISSDRMLGDELSRAHRLVVQFRTVARARWFFNHGVQLECMPPIGRKEVTESDFHRALGGYFHVQMHAATMPNPSEWNRNGAI